MKSLLFVTFAGILLLGSCKKKKEEAGEATEKDPEYYFTGNIDGASVDFQDGKGSYYTGTTRSGFDNVSGDDTTYYESVTAEIRNSRASADNIKPAVALNIDYNAVGSNNIRNMDQFFTIGTHDLPVSENPEFTFMYHRNLDAECFLCSPDYMSGDNGTITFTEVTYLGTDEFFDKISKLYKVKGSVDCYVYDISNPDDSIHVQGNFSFKFESKAF